MKNITLSICLVLLSGGLSLFTSCTKSNITFDLPITLSRATYGPAAGQQWLVNYQTATAKLDSFVTAKGGSLSNLISILPKSLTVTANSPKNFNQFLYADAWIKDSADSVKIFFLAPIPKDSTTVTFGVDDTDISSFVKANSFTISLRAFDSTIVTTVDTFSPTMTFTVTVGPNK